MLLTASICIVAKPYSINNSIKPIKVNWQTMGNSELASETCHLTYDNLRKLSNVTA